ncbi:MAG: glycosyltransferase [Chloroflexi bacterium]|nr:glycosyltransferase [Chloroflexota bacterium]
MMKILQLNVVYGEGSTGRIVQALHKGFLLNGIESSVLFGRGPVVNERYVRKVGDEAYGKYQALLSRITGVMYGGCFLSTARIIEEIEAENPDIVLLHCLNGHFVNIFRLIRYLKRQAINTILVLHAEFMFTGSCGHSLQCSKWLSGCGNCPQLRCATNAWFFDRTAYSWKRMKDAFNEFRRLKVVSVSPWLSARAMTAPILMEAEHHTILNGVDSGVFKYSAPETLVMDERIKGKKVVMHVTASFSGQADDVKGGRFVFALAERFKGESVIFVVARNAGSYMALPNNVLDLGKIRDPRLLAHWYSVASATLLTSERETFSMVCAESLCCGTPVVGFRAGAPEMISMAEYSEFVEFGDVNALEAALRSAISVTIDKAQLSAEARKHYSSAKMIDNYVELVGRLLQKDAKVSDKQPSASCFPGKVD